MQIIGNLISNAIKFTADGGKVTVGMKLEAENVYNKLFIDVSDTGVGLNEDAITNILSGNSKSTEGTGGEVGYGFGLALVKHLIAGLDGTFNIVSEPGKGATFKVMLPMKQ